MAERGSRKIPVTEREFLWVQDDDKGEVVLHVGPTMVSPTAADRIVVNDGSGGFREDRSNRPQRMIEVRDHQYAVLENPLLEVDEGANGRFKTGRNESRPLRNGTRKMIPGPCSFWLRPGQRCEVRDSHVLASNQYLVVKVYGHVVEEAPYSQITIQSAGITRSTDETDGAALKSGGLKTALVPGQLIVIRGLDTQLYIPPTGVDVVPDTSVDASGQGLSGDKAKALLNQLAAAPSVPPIAAQELEAMLNNVADEPFAASESAVAEEEEGEDYDRSRGRRRAKGKKAPRRRVAQSQQSEPLSEMPPQAFVSSSLQDAAPQALMSIPAVREALEREARQARLVRDAVVLGEKEYCVIIDADGKRQIKVGPARVFPGPYDQFLVTGSRNRVYGAYELLPQRAIWLRVISRISGENMAKHLPRNISIEQDWYEPGDELIITGANNFFFPFNEIEILSPENGQSVFGNDHSNVFIEAIGIDQKSGIYVSDLSTGEVRLVRGKRSYLVDPRKEVHIPRRTPVEVWNLWIAHGEPHKVAAETVSTWWALSIVVPPNTACLATSANSQRVIEGPCVTLLEFEERLVPLDLSMQVPKTDDNTLRTCFLRVNGNRVSDEIVIETNDFVEIAVRVSYSVTFQRENKERWFSTENYVQVMCEHLRSLVRNTCRAQSLIELWPSIPALIRDTILGAKDGEGRPGRVFADYSFTVTEVEVLSSEIKDPDIAGLMRELQKESVALQIGDRQAQEKLDSAKTRSEIDSSHHELNIGSEKRGKDFEELTQQLQHEVRLAGLQLEELVAQERVRLAGVRELASIEAHARQQEVAQAASLERIKRETTTRVDADRLAHAEQLEMKRAFHELEMALIAGQSAATVAEREAVQESLVEAMTALGDKVMLAEVAKNMNLVSLFKGKDVGSILTEILGGTRAVATLENMRSKHGPKKGG